MRNALAIAVGLVVAGLVVFLLYILGPQFFTFPKGANPMDPVSPNLVRHCWYYCCYSCIFCW